LASPNVQAQGGLANRVFTAPGQQPQAPPPRSGQSLEAMWRALMNRGGAEPPPPAPGGMMAPPPGEEMRGMDVGAPPPISYGGGAPGAAPAPGMGGPAPYQRPYSAMLFGHSVPMAPWRMIEEEAKRIAQQRKIRPQRTGPYPDAKGGAAPDPYGGGLTGQDLGAPSTGELGPATSGTFSL